MYFSVHVLNFISQFTFCSFFWGLFSLPEFNIFPFTSLILLCKHTYVGALHPKLPRKDLTDPIIENDCPIVWRCFKHGEKYHMHNSTLNQGYQTGTLKFNYSQYLLWDKFGEIQKVVHMMARCFCFWGYCAILGCLWSLDGEECSDFYWSLLVFSFNLGWGHFPCLITGLC